MTATKTLIERPNGTLELIPVAITTVEEAPIRTEIIGHALCLIETPENPTPEKVHHNHAP